MLKKPGHCRCPNCSGNMDFCIKMGKLRCGSCETVLTVEEYEKEIERKEEIREGSGNSFAGGADINTSESRDNQFKRTYTCSSCGGELSPESLGATEKCPFCGNSIIFTDKYRDQKTPDVIGVFLRDRDDFMNIWHKEITERRSFVPDEFAETVVVRKVTPVYVPFWFFDVSAGGHVEYTAETVKSAKLSNDTKVHRAFKGSASGKMSFLHIPQDATTEIDDDISQGLEPYDFSSVKPFSFAYLSGMDARIFNMDEGASFKTVTERVSDTLDRYLTDAENYQYINIARREYDIKQESVSYALMPLWYMEVIWKKRKYTVAMNGQTGMLVCEVPMSKLKYYLFLISEGALTFSVSLFAYLPVIRYFEEHISSGELLIFADILTAGIVAVILYAAGIIRLFRSVISSVISFICCLLISVPLSVYLFNQKEMFDLLKYIGTGVHLVVCAVLMFFLASFIRETNDETAMKFRYEADDYKNNENCTVEDRKVDLLWEKTTTDSTSLIDGIEPKPGFTGSSQKNEIRRNRSEEERSG